MMDCPLCDMKHEVEERSRSAAVVIKGVAVLFDETYLYCVNADEYENEFVTGSMVNQNLLNARTAYRNMKGTL